MSKKKHNRMPIAHAFGPAYGKWLDLWESYEDYVADRIPLRKLKPFTYNQEVFDFTLATPVAGSGNLKQYEVADQFVYQNLFKIWGANAASLRSSFKFKIEDTQWMLWTIDKTVKALDNKDCRMLADLEDKISTRQSGILDADCTWSGLTTAEYDELFEGWEGKGKFVEVTTYLPFENVYIQYEANGGRSTLALCERRTLDRDYPEMGLLAGETFICLTPAGYNANGFKGAPNEKLGCYPIEIHFREGVEWVGRARPDDPLLTKSFGVEWTCPAEDGPGCPPILEATPEGVSAKNWELQNHSSPYINALFALLAMLSNSGCKQTNYGKVKPENVIRRKPAHKKQHPMYEYRVLEIGLGDEAPVVNVQIPRECAKKRLHAVRGFFRHYKKPLKSGPNKGKTKVLVKGHWRGDKELGVVWKDYTFANSEIPETV